MTLKSLAWQPTATLALLQLRATVYARIRQFFAERAVLEVETPIMSHAAVSDPYLVAIPVLYQAIGNEKEQALYLHTSPEYSMKRLLAAGSGSIFQICKTFRNGEIGRIHNPEFTMLEWYRTGFDHLQLMDEVDLLLQYILDTQPAERLTYEAAFLQYADINPHQSSTQALHAKAIACGINLASEVAVDDKDTWLQLLMSDVVEPQLGKTTPTFIYDFPASQAALARVRPHKNYEVAERFEVYFKGMELANGFHELADAKEQAQRFTQDLVKRKQLGFIENPIDNNLLAALDAGFPDCAGVALGIDRLIMLAANVKQIAEVLSFPHERA